MDKNQGIKNRKNLMNMVEIAAKYWHYTPPFVQHLHKIKTFFFSFLFKFI